MTRARRASCGTSLIEVLAAMSLFAIVASAVAVLVTGSLRHTTRNRHGTMATILAQQKLEELRGIAYQDIHPTAENVTAADQPFTVATAVLDNVPASGMKQITVTVTWTGPEGTQTYVVHTIYTQVTA
jgi:prepilin-type N-terminal cleavage/methylation domain-containing protein